MLQLNESFRNKEIFINLLKSNNCDFFMRKKPAPDPDLGSQNVVDPRNLKPSTPLIQTNNNFSKYKLRKKVYCMFNVMFFSCLC